jgi:uncharacterized membrane protein YdbT with pleckstrin-like domain
MLGWYFKWEGLALLITLLSWYIYHTGHLSLLGFLFILLVLNGFVLLVGRIVRKTTTYQITTKRVRGYRRNPKQLFRLHQEEAPIARIDNVTVDQSLLQQMLGVGTIDFDTAGEKSGDILRWWGVENPRQVATKIENVMSGDWEEEEDPEDPDEDSPYFGVHPRDAQRGYIEETQ